MPSIGLRTSKTSLRAIFLGVLILLLTTVSYAQDSLRISADEYAMIQSVSMKIAQACPPADCVVIGVGRSPTPFIAWLQNNFSEYAFNLPLSRFRHSPNSELMIPETDPMMGTVDVRPLSTSQEQELFSHFQKFIPHADKLGNRRIMLVDFSLRGFSLFAAQGYLERFLRSNAMKSELSAFAIIEQGNTENIKRNALGYGVNEVLTYELNTESDLFKSLRTQQYDGFSEYPSFQIGKTQHLGRQERYQNLLIEIHRGEIKSCAAVF